MSDAAQDATYPFGWRGFRFELPLPWEPGSLKGDDASGYLRFDDPLMQCLEVKYDRSYRDTAAEVAAENYIKQLKHAAKKDRPFRREPEAFDVGAAWPEGMRGQAVRWSGDVECVALFLACETCRRVSALQVLFPERDLRLSTVRRLVETFEDHPADFQAPVLWSLYRLHLETPAAWRLTGHEFGPGHARLQFSGPGGLQADVRRAGPAEVLLRKTDLEAWLEAQLPKRVKLDPARVQRAEARGDPVLVATREPRGLGGLLGRLGRGDAALAGRALEATAWHCPATNRLWAVQVYAKTLDAAAEADWRVVCHAAAPPEGA